MEVKLDKESSELTRFQTPFRRYCWLRLLFGLCLNRTCIVVDDLLIYGYSKTDEEALNDHDRNLI